MKIKYLTIKKKNDIITISNKESEEKFMKRMFYVSWNDWNGGVYCRSFKTKEEKEKFIKRIGRTDKKGNKNYKTWED